MTADGLTREYPSGLILERTTSGGATTGFRLKYPLGSVDVYGKNYAWGSDY